MEHTCTFHGHCNSGLFVEEGPPAETTDPDAAEPDDGNEGHGHPEPAEPEALAVNRRRA